jgi:hypothetical protein
MSENDVAPKKRDYGGMSNRQFKAILVTIFLGIAFGGVLIYLLQPVPADNEYSIEIEAGWTGLFWGKEPIWINFELVIIDVSTSMMNSTETITTIDTFGGDGRSGLSFTCITNYFYKLSALSEMTLIAETGEAGISQKTYFPIEWFNWKESAFKGEYLTCDFGISYYSLTITLTNPGEV